MIYATLDEAWTQKSRIRRVKKIKNVQPVTFEKREIVLKDPELVSLLKEVPDPDAYILERITRETEKVESFVPKKESKNDRRDDDMIYFLYFLILLVLLY